MSNSVPEIVRAADLADSLGVNTHFDFNNYGYQNLSTAEAAITYLGVTNLRDSADQPNDYTLWAEVAKATGVKFDDFLGEASYASMTTELTYVPTLAQEGILNYVEGGNEEDDTYPAALGNTLALTAAFQSSVYAMGQKVGLPVINMSFGAGWTAANNWHGNYDKVGDLSAYATYGNSHTYPTVGATVDASIQQINADAKLAAASLPAITTEIGWDNATYTQAETAKYVLDASLDGMKDGNPKTYFYALFDDGSGQFGLMNSDGTARPAGTALHDLTTLLADTGATASTFATTTLAYTLVGTLSTDFSMMLEKSDGSHWLALWNESEAAGSPHTVTLNLGTAATSILVFDPLTGTSSIQTGSGTSISVSVPDHPILIEIIDPGTSVIIPPITPIGSSPTPLVTLPSSATSVVAKAGTISGISLSDAWAVTAPGTLVLNLAADQGSFSVTNATGTLLTSTAGALHLTGTLAALNAELATLAFTGTTAGTAHLTVDMWDQGGQESIKTLAVVVTAAAAVPPVTPVTPSGPNPVVVLPTAAASDVAKVAKALTGVSLSDPWAATVGGHGGLNLSVDQGSLSIRNSTGTTTVTATAGSPVSLSDTLANLNRDLATMVFTGATAGTAHVTVDYWDQAGLESTKTLNVTVTAAAGTTTPVTASSPNPLVVLPTSVVTDVAHVAKALTGVSLSDPWAATVGGTGGLNLSVDQGSLSVRNSNGTTTVTATAGAPVSLSDTLANLNRDLATMVFTGATTGTAHVTVDYWDQAGLESTKVLNVTVNSPAAVAPAAVAVIAVSGNNAAITSLTTTASTTMSFLSSATLATAAASGNLTAMPGAGAAAVTLTPNFNGGAILDFRPTMAQTNWDGKLGDLANYVQLGATTSGAATVTIDPTGVTGGAASLEATLLGQGGLSLATLSHHAIF